MRKLVLILILALLLGGVTYQFLTSQEGYLVLAFGDYVLETTLWGGLVVLLLAFLALYLLYKLVQMLAFPRHWWQARVDKKRLKDRDKTAQGVIDYLEGNWPRAADNFTGSVNHSETPGVNYLGAAAANFHMGDEARCHSLLDAAEEKGAADTLAVGLLRARVTLQNRDYDKALTQVELLHRKSPSHPTVLRLLASARKGIGDWHGLELLLPDLRRHKALSEEELPALELEVYRAKIDLFPETKTANKSAAEQQAELDHLWHGLPGKLKKNSELVAAYVRQLQLLGMPEKAESRLRRFINKEWHDQLALIYGDLEADTDHQLRVAEAWLKDHPDNPYLLETLGQLCVRAELWGKGREYYEMALQKNPQPRTWLALGDLMQRLKDQQASIDCYRKGLGESIAVSSRF